MARMKRFKAPKIVTVIGVGSTVKGDISFTGGLHVDGAIVGNVFSDDDRAALILSSKGRVEGDLKVPSLVLNGEVKGDVYGSQRVELAPKARITGTVYYSALEMAMGAEVNGQLVHTDEEPQRMLSYDRGETEEVVTAEEE